MSCIDIHQEAQTHLQEFKEKLNPCMKTFIADICVIS